MQKKHCLFCCVAPRFLLVKSNQPTRQSKGERQMFETLKSRYSTWKRYSRTVSELQSLSNRELADLGISRSDIPRLARETARA